MNKEESSSCSSSSTNKPINSSNIGFKLLKKQGWKEGTGLGLSQQGRLHPLPAHLKTNRKGLGAEKFNKERPQLATKSDEEKKKAKAVSKRMKKMQEIEKREQEKEFEKAFFREFWPENETFWIKATAAITDFKQTFWYIGCSKCYKTTHTDCGKIYNCLLCNQRDVTAKPRCRFEVELRDTTGTIKANCLGHNAEKLFSITATELKERTNESGLLDESYLRSVTPAKEQALLIKPYDNQGTYKGERKLTIVAIEDEDTNSAEVEIVESSKESMDDVLK